MTATAALTAEHHAVLAAIPVWRRHSKKAPAIAAAAGIEERDRSARRTRNLVHDLRLQGHAIASDDRGYWLAETAEDLEQTRAQLCARIRSTSDVISALEATRRRLFGNKEGGLFE